MDKVQESLDFILELSEERLSEGDYITVSKNLKEIYDYLRNETESSFTILPTNHISRLYSMQEQREDHVSFRLTVVEQYKVMRDRIIKNYDLRNGNMVSELSDLKLSLKMNTKEKKIRWAKLKELKAKLDEQRSQIQSTSFEETYEERMELVGQIEVETSYRKNLLLINRELSARVTDLHRRICNTEEIMESRMLQLNNMYRGFSSTAFFEGFPQFHF